MSLAPNYGERPQDRRRGFVHRVDNIRPASPEAAGAESTALRARIAHILFHEGVCLIRGLPLGDVAAFHRAVASLGLSEEGAQPPAIDECFHGTAVDPAMIVGYHTELCHARFRPAVVAFYCKTPPLRYGETPIFDAARVFERLPTEIRARLQRGGVQYRQFLPGPKRQTEFVESWARVYKTLDPAAVEPVLTAQGHRFEWLDGGDLQLTTHVPAVIVDPASGRPCLNVNMYEPFAWIALFDRFKERFRRFERRRLVDFVRAFTSGPRPYIQTRWGDGEAFDRADAHALQGAMWDSAQMFSWKRNDLLLLNNIRYAHARLNIVSDREIYTINAAPYDSLDTVARSFSIAPRRRPPT